MKKFAVLLTTIFVLTASSASAIGIVTAVLGGLAVAKDLLPIVQELGDTLIAGPLKDIANLISGKECNWPCPKPLLACRWHPTFSKCKRDCQQKIRVDGYQIRIRFGKKSNGETWNLEYCMQQAFNAGIQDEEGKGNLFSIAVYSKDDLDYLMGLIGIRRAAQMIIDTKGHPALVTNDAKTTLAANAILQKLLSEGKTPDQILTEAKELSTHIDQTIVKKVQLGTKPGGFGFQ